MTVGFPAVSGTRGSKKESITLTGTTQDQPLLGSRLAYLSDDVTKIADALGRNPEAARELRDQQLVAIAAWTEDGNQVIRDECRRRAEQGRTFAAYLDQPTLGEILRRLLD